MELILDRQNSTQPKSSWKPVLIINGILLCIPLYYCYYYSFIETSDRPYQTANIITSSLFFICIWTVVANILFLLISLFFSKTYWKKWLIVIVVGVFLFIVVIIFGLYIGKIAASSD